MTALRAAAALVTVTVIALAAPAPALAAGLTVERIAKLSDAGLSDAAILRIAEEEGFAVPLTSERVLKGLDLGIPADLLSRLVEMSAEEGTAIEVAERDGVTVITGRGPDEASEPEPAEREEAMGPAGEPPALPPVQQVVVVGGVAPAGETVPSSFANGFPADATFGWSGGAVFLPARFGGSRPSAFGRTIVGFTQGPTELCVPLAPAPILVERPERRMIPVRTSRGVIYLPN
jgi:hypothetical protein